MSRGYKSILVISDLHFPYAHFDVFSFLKAIKKKYKPDKVVLIGDEVDGHSWSFHQASPDLPNPTQEFENAVRGMKELYKIFPTASVIDSNHGSLIFRKQQASSLPRSVFKSYNAMLEAPKGWKWTYDLTLKMSDGNSVYFHHGKTSAVGKLSKNMSMSAVQGHYHSRFEIIYWANPNGLYFDMRIGCLIDDKSLAFSYNKTTLDRPIIGCGIIIDGQPKLLPLIKNDNGRWIGKLK
jgi:hypothetical protein